MLSKLREEAMGCIKSNGQQIKFHTVLDTQSSLYSCLFSCAL